MPVVKARNFRGTKDFSPSEMIPRERMIDSMKHVFRLFGFSPLETPALEMLEVLSGKYGKEGEQLLYKLDYKNDRPADRVALRYDLTVPLARFIAMNPDLPLPFKRYQVQPVWRADRPQPRQGRFREFYQCDVDSIGSEEGLADAEIIAVSVKMLQQLGFERDDKRAVIQVNHRKILEALNELSGLSPGLFMDFCRVLDKTDKIGWDEVSKELLELGTKSEALEKLSIIFEQKGEFSEKLDWFENEIGSSESAADGINGLRVIYEHLRYLEIPNDMISFEPRLARGLDYYTGAVFETMLPNHPHIGSLTGGGRYDKLIGLYSGRDLPAVGTTIGLDRIFAAMNQLEMVNKDSKTITQVLIAAYSENEMPESIEIASLFRQAGIETDIFPTAGKMKKPFNYADKMGIPFVAVVGPDEVADPDMLMVTLKNLSISTQETLLVVDAIHRVGSPR